MAWLTEEKRRNKATGKAESYFAVQWRVGAKTRTKGLGFIPKAEATAMLKIIEGKLAAGVDPTPPPTAPGSAPAAVEASAGPTLAKYLDEVYMPVVKRDKAPKTYRGAAAAAKALKAGLGARSLSAVDFKAVDAYLTTRRALGRRARTLAIELWLLRGCLAHAAYCAVISEVPRLPTVKFKDQVEHRFLTDEDSKRLLAQLRPLAQQPHRVTRGAPPVMRDRLTYLAVLMALNLGMRKGEILSRGWEDLRWTQGRNGTLLVGGKLELGFQVKTRRERTIPLTPEIARELRNLHDDLRRPASGWIFPAPHDPEKPRQDFGIALRRACKRAGIPVIHPHGLRHTWASRLAMAGVDRRTLMDLGGWSSGAMLDHVYAHATDAHKDDVMARSGIAPGPDSRAETPSDTSPPKL